jgi:hypothetical protein
MNTVTITAVDPSKCTEKKVGFITEPVLTEEVMKEVQKNVHKGAKLRIALEGVAVTVSGNVFPPQKDLIVSTMQILNKGYYAVEERHAREAAEHKNLVESYAKTYGLPVFEG